MGFSPRARLLFEMNCTDGAEENEKGALDYFREAGQYSQRPSPRYVPGLMAGHPGSISGTIANPSDILPSLPLRPSLLQKAGNSFFEILSGPNQGIQLEGRDESLLQA